MTTIQHGTPFIESELILDALMFMSVEDPDDAAENAPIVESVRERLLSMLPSELRHLQYAAETLAAWAQRAREEVGP